MDKKILKLFRTKPIKLSCIKLKKINIASKKIKELSRIPNFDKRINSVYKMFL